MNEKNKNEPFQYSTPGTGGLSVKPAVADESCPNFGLTPFNWDGDDYGFVFEPGVPEEVVVHLTKAVNGILKEKFPMVLSPENQYRITATARDVLSGWIECGYLVRSPVKGQWIWAGMKGNK